MTRIAYLTFDGLLEPLGTSQVVRPLLALARRGFPYVVASLEKPHDLQDTERVRRLERELSAASIRWLRAPYARGGGAVATNVGRMLRLGREASRGADLVHARAHLSAAVAWGLRAATRLPYLFDFRGFWVDEQREQGRWVTRRAPYAIAKAGERRLVRDAEAIVTLTQLARDDLRAGALGPCTPEVHTITTVADYDELTREGPTDRVPAHLASELRGKLVVAYIGAINVSYASARALSLFAKVAARRPDAHLLCLTRQSREMRALLAAHRIVSATVTDVDHRDVAHWLRLVDWALLLLEEPYAKRGSMPTKLGELFAAGVRPVQGGCNAEVRDWVRRAGTGIVLESFDERSLDEAARRVASEPRDEGAIARARAITAPHFALAAGVERYAALLARLTGKDGVVTSPGMEPIHA